MHIQLHHLMMLQQSMNALHRSMRFGTWANRFCALVCLALVMFNLALPSQYVLLNAFVLGVNGFTFGFMIVPTERRWHAWCKDRTELAQTIEAMRERISYLHGHLL